MNKEEINIHTKYKAIVSFNPFKTKLVFNSKIEINEHYLHITILSSSLSSSIEILKGIFNPLYQNLKGNYYINLLFITSVTTTNDNSSLVFDAYNPVMNTSFNFTLSKIETQSLLFKKKLSKEGMKKIIQYIENKKKSERNYLINKFISLISLFKECLEPQKKENQTIVNVLVSAYVVGKNYYDKYSSIFKHNKKIKTGIKKQLTEKLKLLEYMIPEQELLKQSLGPLSFDSLIGEFKLRTSFLIQEGITFLLQIINADSKVMEYEKIDKYLISENLHTLQDSIECSKSSVNLKKINKTFSNNKNNKSTELFHNKNMETLAQLNLTDDSINIKNIKLGKNDLFSVSTKTTSKDKEKLKNKISQLVKGSDMLETPKFFSKNNNKLSKKIIIQNNNKYIQNKIGNKKYIGSDDGISVIEMTKHIDNLCELHAFVPPTDIFNIFLNTAEIIYRKFFEGCFKTYFTNLFLFEVDKDGLIKIDALYNYFFYLRALKKFLFKEESQISMASLLYMTGELNA